VGLPGIMHVKTYLLDDVGDVRAGERQVLEGSNEAPEVSQISNRRLGLIGDLGLCVPDVKTSLQSTMPACSRISRAN
jgi:hypothetical protein